MEWDPEVDMRKCIETDEWVSITPATRICQRSVPTLRRLAMSGELPVRRGNGGWWLFYRPALEAYARKKHLLVENG
jgi:hypothetical protein